ncbi:hypothetical protein RHSP_66726 [Rhizobium freirei PRF 81]|uniref:Uncharacterized protein n=1 Tax=Rhizobium freirei PRF 81 TaxID=363754 RepID=N6V892_9HYPH|nr:hypothetical protein RHSP_66726 [Rhizobium freirei PRF 81]
MDTQLFGAGACDRVEDQAGREQHAGNHGQGHGEDPARQARHQPGFEIFHKDWDREADAHFHGNDAQDAEEGERPRFFHQHREHPEDLPAVTEGGKLRMRAFRPPAIVEFQFADGQFQPRGVNRHFRLDLEAARNGREALDETARKGAVAGEDVGEIRTEDTAIEPVEDTVAEGVALAAGIVVHVAAGADDHVGAFGQKRADQLFSILGRIGAVAIGHKIDIGFDVGEHASYHMPLALPAFAHDGRAGEHGVQRRAVGGIVVIDIDAGLRQSLAETAHDLADRCSFVVAGQQDGDVQLLIPHGLGRFLRMKSSGGPMDDPDESLSRRLLIRPYGCEGKMAGNRA